MDRRDYLREFISSNITVESHSNALFLGMKGHIIYETARTFVVSVNGETKIVPKTTGKFAIKSDRFSITLKGDSIMMRPEERLKNLRKIIKQENKGDDYN